MAREIDVLKQLIDDSACVVVHRWPQNGSLSWTNVSMHANSLGSPTHLPLQCHVVRGHLLSKKRIDILQTGRLFAKIPSVTVITDALLGWSRRARNCRQPYILCATCQMAVEITSLTTYGCTAVLAPNVLYLYPLPQTPKGLVVAIALFRSMGCPGLLVHSLACSR